MAELIKGYSGEQIVLSSGRLVFNSRSNDIYLNSKRYINLSAGDKVTIDVGNVDSDNEANMFLVNAPRVQFGLDKNGSAEPVVKGEQLDDILTEMMQALADYSDMVTALAISPPLLASASGFLKGRFQEIKLKLDDFKSPTSFTI
jgi:hypothetical protein